MTNTVHLRAKYQKTFQLSSGRIIVNESTLVPISLGKLKTPLVY